MTGRVIGNYRIVERLGRGGQGKVYRAVDTMVERQVAIKVLRPEIARDPEMLERFRAEAVALAQLNHPGIAQLYAFLCEGGDYYMVMEYVPGLTLAEIIHEQGPLPWPRAAAIAAQILDAIAFAHSRGILHRDLKPANVMVPADDRVKVMDFGIAQIAGKPKMTREGRIVGTVEYLAPERIRGEAPGERSDLYSLGIVLYEMLTGRVPFEASTEYGTMMAQLNDPPAPPEQWGVQLPEALVAIVGKALEKDPNRRFPDAASFAAALRSLRVTPPPAPARPPATQWNLSRFGGKSIALAVFLFALLTALLVWRYQRDDPWQAARTLPAPEAPVIPPVETSPLPKPPPVSYEPIPVPAPSPVTRPTPVAPKPAPVKRPAAVPGPAPTEPGLGKEEPARPAHLGPAPVPPPTARTEPSPPPAAEPAPPARTEPPARPPKVIRSIRDVERIYVEKTEGELDGFLRTELRERLGGRLGVASSPGEADAIMQVRIEQLKGGALSRAGRVFGVSDKRRIQARVISASSGRVLWEERAGDRQLLTGAFLGDAGRRLASRIVEALQRDLR
jgi:serine/threonine-protein kinase